MTYKQWEWELKCLLRGVSKKEIEEITNYYAEIYGDKKDAGFTDIDILMEFGTPEECAERIKSEGLADLHSNAEPDGGSASTKKFTFNLPDSEELVRITLLTVFAVIPLSAIALALLSIPAAVSISGAVAAIGGAATVIWSIVQLFMGNGFSVFAALLGIGVGAIGVGVILSIVFFFITKRAAIFAYKRVKSLYSNKKGAK